MAASIGHGIAEKLDDCTSSRPFRIPGGCALCIRCCDIGGGTADVWAHTGFTGSYVAFDRQHAARCISVCDKRRCHTGVRASSVIEALPDGRAYRLRHPNALPMEATEPRDW